MGRVCAGGLPDRRKLLARPGHSRCDMESSEARPGQGSGARAVARHRGHRFDRSESLRLRRPPRKAAALARLDGRTDPGAEHHRLLRESPGDDRSRAGQGLRAALHGARRRSLLRRRRHVPDRRARGNRRVGREREGARAAGRQPPAGRRRQAHKPLCPYPQVARYRGQGSTDEASNFACEPPRPR